MDPVSDALGLEMLQHLVDRVPVLVLSRVHGKTEARLARLLEQCGVVTVLEIRMRRTGDVDADDAPVPVSDGLLDDYLVQRVGEGPIETEEESGLHRIFEARAIEAADRRHDDVV